MKINLSLFKKPMQKFEQEELTNKFTIIKQHNKHINKCLSYFFFANMTVSSLIFFNTLGKQTYEFFPIVMSILMGSIVGVLLAIPLSHFAELFLNKTKTFKLMKHNESLLINDLAIKLEVESLQFSLLKNLDDHILELKSFEFEEHHENNKKDTFLKELNNIKEELLLYFSENNLKDAATYLLKYETIVSIENSYEVYKVLETKKYTMIKDSFESNEKVQKYKAKFTKYFDNKNHKESELEKEYDYKQHF